LNIPSKEGDYSRADINNTFDKTHDYTHDLNASVI